jgi:pyruvate dehydrogenase E2 component (dihydrolipoamide acetyltransferase)
MPREFRLPDLGEGIHEGEVVEVLVSVGDRVIDGKPILVIETDKATTEIPSPVTGVVQEIRVKPGEVVKVGDVLMVFVEDREAEAPPKAQTTTQPERPLQPESSMASALPSAIPAPAATALPRVTGPAPAAPSTRRLARELGVHLDLVPPTGSGGRVTPEDVRAFADNLKHAAELPKPPPLPAVAPPAAEVPPTAIPMPSLPQAVTPISDILPTPSLPDFARWGPVSRDPLRSVRKATARHMALAWSQIPHVTHQDVVDITELEAFRRRHKEEIGGGHGALSLTVFAMKAAAAALKTYPRFNASLDVERQEIILKQYYHLGVAVDTDRGLIVPVVRDVDRKSITQLAVELNDLAARARAAKIEREELSGGTFTITNIGVLGGTGFAPIVNYPEVAILGMARATWQPVVKVTGDDFEVVPRLMLPLILGFDHRVVDGADAARFMGLIMETLGDPERLLMMI